MAKNKPILSEHRREYTLLISREENNFSRLLNILTKGGYIIERPSAYQIDNFGLCPLDWIIKTSAAPEVGYITSSVFVHTYLDEGRKLASFLESLE